MKVLLVNPSYPFEESPTPPFGLMSLAAYLLENDIDVRIEDYIVTPYSRERVKKVLQEYKPDVVGATGVTMNINTALRVVKDYKEENPNIHVVMGGPHVTFDADNILMDNPYVDSVNNGLTYLVQRFKGEKIAGTVTLYKGERSELAELAANLL